MNSRASFGLLLIIVGVLALCFVSQIQDSGLGHNKDPGPRAFPVGLAVCLIIGGLLHTIRVMTQGRSVPEPADIEYQRSEQRLNPWRRSPALILLSALVLYIAAMPWLGFSISTFLFAAGMMGYLGTRWWLALVVPILMIVVIRLLFVSLFKVQLPEGVLANSGLLASLGPATWSFFHG